MKDTKFRQLLKKVDINGAQLARKLQVTVASVGQWTRGKQIPPVKKWQDIAKALGVSVNEVAKCFIEDTKNWG